MTIRPQASPSPPIIGRISHDDYFLILSDLCPIRALPSTKRLNTQKARLLEPSKKSMVVSLVRHVSLGGPRVNEHREASWQMSGKKRKASSSASGQHLSCCLAWHNKLVKVGGYLIGCTSRSSLLLGKISA